MEKPADASAQLQLLPEFRFHPTDEELLVHYLARKVASRPFPIPIIAELDLYRFDSWDLPEKAHFGEKEWYFFSPRDRKYPNGARPNRAAASGYWKATGTDKPIYSASAGNVEKVGVKKALVFYTGRAPRGVKTNWIMHEYRLTDSGGKPSFVRRKGSSRLDDWVLCRIYNRCVGGSQKLGSQKLKLSEKKLEADEELESCLEDVLASLPDIEDSNIFLPRIGSRQNYIQHDPSLFDRILSEGIMSESGSKSTSALSQTDLANLQERIMQKSDTDDPSIPQVGSQLSSAHPDQELEMGFSEICDSEPKNHDRASIYRPLKRAREMNMPHLLQNVRSATRQKVSFDSSADDDVQSTCRSPMFSRQPNKDQGTDFQLQFLDLSVEKCFSPDSKQTDKDNNSFFVNINDLFPAF